MSIVTTALQWILLILVVVTLFNIIIFVHELGHFLAARWRGLHVDRFQIWFGKPIWKKEINGVQYGMGWIPAGGFVSLPQMAPMESIEGTVQRDKPLPKITPLDKIIVAFAGPLFSMLLALLSAVVVWGVGKPKDFVPSTQVGYVVPDSPASKAGLQVGDKIVAINGDPVSGFAGSLDSISERIILSRGKEISFTVQRPGVAEVITLNSGFETEESKWFQRRGLRQVGIEPSEQLVVHSVLKNGPAAVAGLVKGDRIVDVDGQTIYSMTQFSQYLKKQDFKAVKLTVEGKTKGTREVELVPEIPIKPEGSSPKVGILWDPMATMEVHIVHPGPLEQVKDSLRMMWVTISTVAAPDSNVGVDHLSGPVGIAKVQFDLLQMEDGWRRVLAFMVLFNVNLAVLNMMPFPVLDGGHITLAILEKIFGKPVKAKPLEILQTACALGLISLMLYVTSKDVGDLFGGSRGPAQEMIFSEK